MQGRLGDIMLKKYIQAYICLHVYVMFGIKYVYKYTYI